MGEQSEVFYKLISEIIYQKEQSFKYFLDYQKVEIFQIKNCFSLRKMSQKKRAFELNVKNGTLGWDYFPQPAWLLTVRR